MAKVKIQGNASGTGVLTVTAPNTSTDRTITLPDSTGTLLTADGDGSSLTGVADATKLPLAGGTMTGDLLITKSSGDVSLTLYASENSGAREPQLNLKGYATNSNPVINFGDHAGYAGAIEYENQDNSMRLWTNTSEKVRIHSSGVTSFNNGIELGSGLDATAANTLGDFEEGTFTPTLGSSNSRNGTWSSAIGRYIKIGNMVTLFIDIEGSGMYFTSERGWQNITNLPFSATQPSNSENYAGSWSGNAVAYSMGGSVYLNASSMYLHAANTNWNTSGISGIGVCISYLT